MTINITVPQPEQHLKPRITVIGVGGAGGNAVNNMITAQLGGVEFVVANTDAQALAQSLADRKIQLGANITNGLGAGARPDVGRAAAEEAMDELSEQLGGSNMVFITAGMGGGTGTGAAPVIARIAREHGILTVGVVTKPFQFEGSQRMRLADAGIEEMQNFVDTLIIIPNQNLFRIANEKTTFADAFALADDVLHSGVRGVTDLMVVPGLINLDFADIRSVMSEMGKAMMGTGEGDGENRAREAAEAAINNPLLDDVSMKGARGVLINITGGPDLTLYEVDEAANRIGEEVDPEANIIFGSTLDASLEGRMRVSVVATGIDAENQVRTRPVLKVVSEPTERPTPRPSPPSHPGMTFGSGQPQAAQGPAVAPPPVAPQPGPTMQTGSGATAALAQPIPREEPAAVAPQPEMRPPQPHPQPVLPEASVAPERPATASEEPFVPAPPVERTGRVRSESRPAAEPPARPARERGVMSSLFQRMTGAGRPRTEPEGPPQRPAPLPPREPVFQSPSRPEVATTPQPAADAEPAMPAATQAEPVAPAPPAPPPAAIQSPPPPQGPEQSPAAAPAPDNRGHAEQAPAPVQPALGGLSPRDRPAGTSPSEEDLLEIPAFLRRQAN